MKTLKEDRLPTKLYCYTAVLRFHVSWLFISSHRRIDREKPVFALVSRRGRKEKYLRKTIKAHLKKKDYENSCQLFFKEKNPLQLKHFYILVNGKTQCFFHSSSCKRVRCKEKYVQSVSKESK